MPGILFLTLFFELLVLTVDAKGGVESREMVPGSACGSWTAGSQFGAVMEMGGTLLPQKREKEKTVIISMQRDVTLILCNQWRYPICPARLQRSASQCRASHSTPPLLTGWNVVDGMLVEGRNSCVAGAVCDQTDDQLQEQVPGPLWLRCRGSRLVTKSFVESGH